MKIGKAVRTLRACAGLKQHELATRAKLTGAALSLIESGQRDPSLKTLAAIADALEVPRSVLVAVALGEAEPKRSRASEVDGILDDLVLAAQRMVLVRNLREGTSTSATTDRQRRSRRSRNS